MLERNKLKRNEFGRKLYSRQPGISNYGNIAPDWLRQETALTNEKQELYSSLWLLIGYFIAHSIRVMLLIRVTTYPWVKIT